MSYSDNLLRGYIPTIHTAINKSEYFKNELKDKQPFIYGKIEKFENLECRINQKIKEINELFKEN